MKKLLQSALQHMGIICVVMLGFFLIAYNILNDADIKDFASLTKRPAPVTEPTTQPDIPNKGTPKPEHPPKREGEVQNYVLFNHAPFGNKTVVTGIQYASTATNTIERQWCYLTVADPDSGQSKQLELARISSNGVGSVTNFTPKALSNFDLTEESALKLIASHCRFQKHNSKPLKQQKGKPDVKPSQRPAVRRYAWPAFPRRVPLERYAYAFHCTKYRCAAFG